MIIHELQSANTTADKLNLLEKADLSLLVYAYNPDIVYGVKFKVKDIDLDSLQDFTSKDKLILDKLMCGELKGNLAKEVINTHCDEFGDLIKLVCNRDLRCGVTATTINKVHKGLIPVFKVQLAKEVPLTELKYPLWGQLKYDGVRLIMLYDGDKVVFKTRNGKVIHLPETQQKLEARLSYPLVLDNEVTLLGGTTEDRTTVSGMINSARSGNVIDEAILVFNVFDCMKYGDFNLGVCDIPYSLRLPQAESLCDYDIELSQFKIAETKVINSVEEANELFNKYIADGQEGLILKSPNHLYTFKRSKDWAKLKAVKSVELSCVDINRGDGKYTSAIGALVCEGVVEGKQIKVNVGSGLTDHDRTNIAFGEYFNNLIEVKYNSIIQDSKTGEWSLFLPRFVCIRYDKPNVS